MEVHRIRLAHACARAGSRPGELAEADPQGLRSLPYCQSVDWLVRSTKIADKRVSLQLHANRQESPCPCISAPDGGLCGPSLQRSDHQRCYFLRLVPLAVLAPLARIIRLRTQVGMPQRLRPQTRMPSRRRKRCSRSSPPARPTFLLRPRSVSPYRPARPSTGWCVVLPTAPSGSQTWRRPRPCLAGT